VTTMKKEELVTEIQSIEGKIKEYQDTLQTLRQELNEVIVQERERKHYISSKEILDLIYEQTSKQGNMSMIKRWADDGLLGEVVDEKDKFGALRSKQGKKRFLYPKKEVYSFLYEKGYIRPKFEVLDRVKWIDATNTMEIGIIVNSHLQQDQFYYTIQLQKSGEVIKDISENEIQID
jgi:hypothetical protein